MRHKTDDASWTWEPSGPFSSSLVAYKFTKRTRFLWHSDTIVWVDKVVIKNSIAEKHPLHRQPFFWIILLVIQVIKKPYDGMQQLRAALGFQLLLEIKMEVKMKVTMTSSPSTREERLLLYRNRSKRMCLLTACLCTWKGFLRPQCVGFQTWRVAFSMLTVRSLSFLTVPCHHFHLIIRAHAEVEYGSRDVLADPELREGIKKFTHWPTIPQIFINGEFVGGSDILMQMHQKGELQTALEDAKKPNHSWAWFLVYEQCIHSVAVFLLVKQS